MGDIQIKNLNKFYKNKQVLFDFSTSINLDESCIYGLLGPNGAGKTTFIKVLTGLLDYSSGNIQVSGEKNYIRWCKENIVLIPAGERGLRYKNTVYDNIMFFAAMKGIKESKVKNLIDKYAEALQFSDFLSRRAETLSMGEKKKAMLLCGLCTDMKVLIMDEPSNGLDIESQVEMKALIQDLAETYNKTFIISSHDLEFLNSMVQHYIFIFEGKNVGEVDRIMGTEEIRDIYMQKRRGINNDELF